MSLETQEKEVEDEVSRGHTCQPVSPQEEFGC